MTYCHGTESSYRVSEGLWLGSTQWILTWKGVRAGSHRILLTPHAQPTYCQECGFIFSFEGCDRFHLSSCPECNVAYQKDEHGHGECPNIRFDGDIRPKIHFVRVGEI